MLHYCKHCGTVTEDNVQICPFCGKTMEISTHKPESAEPPVVESTPAEKPAPKKFQISAKALLIGIGAIALVAVITIVIVCIQYFAPVPAVERYEAFRNADFEELESLAPPEYWEAQRRSYESVEESFERCKSNCAACIKPAGEISTDIIDRSMATSAHLDQIKEILQEKYEIRPNQVKGGQVLILRHTAHLPDGETSTYFEVVTAIQIDSGWYLWSSNERSFRIDHWISFSWA